MYAESKLMKRKPLDRFPQNFQLTYFKAIIDALMCRVTQIYFLCLCGQQTLRLSWDNIILIHDWNYLSYFNTIWVCPWAVGYIIFLFIVNVNWLCLIDLNLRILCCWILWSLQNNKKLCTTLYDVRLKTLFNF